MGRLPRERKATSLGSDPLPDYLRGRPKAARFGNLSADDLTWLGEDLTLDTDELLKKRGYEPEGALRLILGAIIDAHVVADGPGRAKRLDSAEEALLGVAQKRGNDPYDDEDLLRELARRYFSQWVGDKTREIEVAPLAREILAEAKSAGRIPKTIVEGDVRRLQRKFVADRDRILARATVDLKWDVPEFHRRVLRVLEALQALGVACDARRIIQRIDPNVGNRGN
jgi:hypothetical protein